MPQPTSSAPPCLVPRLAVALAAAGWLVAPAPAAADVVPPDLCDEAGSVCTTDDGVPGVCRASSCSRLSYGQPAPSPDDPEGLEPALPPGPTLVSYPCNRCEPALAVGAPGAGGLGVVETLVCGGVCCVGLLVPLAIGGLIVSRRKKSRADA